MFDLQADDGSVRKKKYKSPIPDTPAPVRQVAGNKLDSSAMTRLHLRLLDIWQREVDRQAANRIDMAIDEDVYDSIQWSEDDAQTLRDRGQVPLVFNVTATTVDWVIGTEKNARTDFSVLPRRKEDGKPAEKKTELLKYLSDVNREPFEVSRAFADGAKVGIGWMEDGWQGDEEGEPIYARYENWRNMLWDSTATQLDIEDGRYVGRSKWVDLDVAIATFPKRKAMLKRSVDDADNFAMLDAYGDYPMDQIELENQGRGDSGYTSDRVTGYRRNRLRIFELWFRMPVETERMRGGVFSGEIFDEFSPGHADEVENGEAEVVKKVMMRTYVALFTSAGMLWLSPSPYRHNKYPFTPIWYKRRGRDGMPYGLVRNVRDIQTDINKRASKALHILSSNKIIMEDGAVDDVTELAEEAARPDAVFVVASGKRFELNADRELSQWHLELMSRNIQMLQQVGGVTDENLGRSTNAVSGVAIEARQAQGQLATSGLFDNHRLAQQIRGEKKLSLTEQFMDQKKQFRITNKRGRPEWIDINDGLPENDIIRTKADFVISEDDWRATVRQAQVDKLLELLGKLAPVAPQVAVVSLDLIVESMDLPQGEELVKRIRQVTGMVDPDAEENDPEQQAQAQAKAQQQQLQSETIMAQLRKLLADAVKAEADAAKSQAIAKEVEAKIAATNINAQSTALDAASKVAIAPALADVADHMLHEAGFMSRTEQESNLRALAEAAAQQQAAAAAQQPPQQQIPPGAAAPAGNEPAQIGLG
ncbi:hypothetical protein ASC97_05710 [Rhizobium sp. Root1203]|uniref:portal protein n=1 Tax=Rhizobium sp. Root1203 TaxID=1736427 RepID=UPI00070AB33B|nr:hypothetical protein [Rhizobium sp. Root1203]KQV27859.1 hypothetical protein ASC97_05710 [Rhizobium sp. Root1203]